MRLLGNRRFLLWGRSMGAATSKLYLILSYLLPQRIQVQRRHRGLHPRLALRLALVAHQANRAVAVHLAWVYHRESARLRERSSEGRASVRHKAIITPEVHIADRSAHPLHHFADGRVREERGRGLALQSSGVKGKTAGVHRQAAQLSER